MPDSKQMYRHLGKQALSPGLAAAQFGGVPSTLLDEGDLAELVSKAVNVRSFTRSDTAAPERDFSQRRSLGIPRTPADGSKTGAPPAPSKFAPRRPCSQGAKGHGPCFPATEPSWLTAVFSGQVNSCHQFTKAYLQTLSVPCHMPKVQCTAAD